MAHDVFVSHSSKDKPTADAVVAMLESKGVRCWVAPRDITPGMDWGEAIVQAVKGARVMVLIFSASANDSPQIKREVERAVNKGIPVIPLRIEDVAPTASLEYFISTPHWLDAFTPPLERHLQYLAQIIQQILGAAGASTVPLADAKIAASARMQPGTTGRTVAASRRSPAAFIVGGILLLALLSAGWWFGIEKPRREQNAQLISLLNSNSNGKPSLATNSPIIPVRPESNTVMINPSVDTNIVAVSPFVVTNSTLLKTNPPVPLPTNDLVVTNLPIPVVALSTTSVDVVSSPPPNVPRTNVLVTSSVPVTNMPPVTPEETTVFQLMAEANRSLGEESKDKLFYARSERSRGEPVPNTWRLGFFDSTAALKVTELKFRDGKKIDTSQPFAVLERYNAGKAFDRKKLKIDSNKALQLAMEDPMLKGLTLRMSEIKLQTTDGPFWQIHLWVGRIRRPSDMADAGQIFISAEDGKVIKRDLHPPRD